MFTLISSLKARHYRRNDENDAYLKKLKLHGRKNITLDEVRSAGKYGFRQAAFWESQLHTFGEGNEHNIKFTSIHTKKESFIQRYITNRFGRYEIILRPNKDGKTYTYVNDYRNMPTLNYGRNYVSHFIYDIIPYFLFGNVPKEKRS